MCSLGLCISYQLLKAEVWLGDLVESWELGVWNTVSCSCKVTLFNASSIPGGAQCQTYSACEAGVTIIRMHQLVAQSLGYSIISRLT